MKKIFVILIACYYLFPVYADSFDSGVKLKQDKEVNRRDESIINNEANSEKARTDPDTDELKKKWTEKYLSVSLPLKELRVTSPYGYRKDPFSGKKKFHKGLDLHARNDNVFAMMAGIVVGIGKDDVSGNYVVLKHGSYQISYCHLSKIFVTDGNEVGPRDVIGISGSTGKSTGEHLHITCRLNGKYIDPEIVINMIIRIKRECIEMLLKL